MFIYVLIQKLCQRNQNNPPLQNINNSFLKLSNFQKGGTIGAIQCLIIRTRNARPYNTLLYFKREKNIFLPVINFTISIFPKFLLLSKLLPVFLRREFRCSLSFQRLFQTEFSQRQEIRRRQAFAL